MKILKNDIDQLLLKELIEVNKFKNNKIKLKVKSN